MSEFERCLKLRRLVPFSASPEMVQKEVQAARHDLEAASSSLKHGNDKWASIQAYYSMFHCAKALVLVKGYREKGHACLLVALRELYIKTGEMEKVRCDDLEMAMDLRLEADYGLVHSDDGARLAIEMAEEMLEAAIDLMG
jgi:uncharacterized protein (UPF0332 family)